MPSALNSHSGGTATGYDVTTTGVKVMPIDPDFLRGMVALVNASDEAIYIALENAAEGTPTTCPHAAGEGIYLAPRGGAYEVNFTNMYYGEIWAIHGGTGTHRLTVMPCT